MQWKVWLYATAMFSHRSKVSYKSLKLAEVTRYTQKSRTIFDSELQNILDSWTHFLYCILDIGSLCAFAKAHGPQEKCIMLYKIGIYIPKAAQ